MIHPQRSPEGSPHHQHPFPSPGGSGDKLSLSPQQVVIATPTDFFLSLFLFAVIYWRLSFISLLARMSAIQFCLFSILKPSSMDCALRKSDNSVNPLLNVTNLYLCICVFQETEHPEQVCSNEVGDLPAKETGTWTDINPTLLRSLKMHFLTSTISSLAAIGHASGFFFHIV